VHGLNPRGSTILEPSDPYIRVTFAICLRPLYRMSSIHSGKSQIKVNALYTNIVTDPTVYNESGTSIVLSGVPGSILVRDMGKIVYLPAPTTPSSLGSQTTILRKVQIVQGYYGTGGTEVDGFSTYYISLGGQTYGGGVGHPGGLGSSGFVRAN